MWCIKTMGKETTRLLLNKLTTMRSSSIFGVGNSCFSQRKRKKFRQYCLRHFIYFLPLGFVGISLQDISTVVELFIE